MEEIQEVKEVVEPTILIIAKNEEENIEILTPPPENLLEDNIIIENKEKFITEDLDDNHDDNRDDDRDDNHENNSNQEDNDDNQENDDDDSSVPEEREEGDGEEEKETKKLDDDEDKKNPQYIPKKGMFYEHDDRTAEGEEETSEEKSDDKKGKKGKVWEEVEKWKHDLYNDDEQSPKSAQELIDAYGYDIRNEEGPPKARRRRRYGKGPNKYQRSWEDENAYMKGSPNQRGRRGGYRGNFIKKEEDFPELPKSAPVLEKPTTNEETKKIFKKVQISDKVTEIEEKPQELKKVESMSFRGPLTRGNVRGRMSQMMRQRPGTGRTPSNISSQETSNTAQDDIATLAEHFSHAVINVDKNIIGRNKPDLIQKENISEKPKNQGIKEKIKTVPVVQQENRSKRYSAQRQRSLPQGNQNYIQQQQPPYYQQPPPVETTPGPNYPGVQVVAFLPPPPLPQPQQPQYPPTQMFVPQPQFIPPPPIAVQPGPAEVYQGITYYSTQSQLLNPPQLPKRVKIAIPIVSPNESPEN